MSHISESDTGDIIELNNIKVTAINSQEDNFLMCKNNMQHNIPHDGLQTNGVSFDSVCQNVFNPTCRHGIALQSESNLPKIATSLTLVVVYIVIVVLCVTFLSCQKRSVPVPAVASLSVKLPLSLIHTYTMSNSQIGIIF